MLKINNALVARLLVFPLSYLLLGGPRLSAATPANSDRTSGVWCDRGSVYAIKEEHEWRLVLSLRRITGFSGLHFTADGVLSLGDPSAIAGGSAEARRLVIRAFCSGAIFIIEDHSGSRSVNFGQVQQEIYKDRDGRSSEVWRLRLDFDDFLRMEASPELRATFDEGFTLLHELLHGLGYKDASSERELGACEEIVNRIRGELELPLRDQYFGEAWRINAKITSVRLRFRSQPHGASAARWKSHYLYFLMSEPAECSANIRAVTRLDKKSRQ